MWQHIVGVKQPKRKNYEQGGSGGKRKFMEKWHVTERGVRRHWLVNDSNTNTMSCGVVSTNKTCSFVIGTHSMKINSTKDHENSEAHKNCVRTSTTAAVPVSTTPTVQSLTAMTDQMATKMRNFFSYSSCLGNERKTPF